MSHPSFAAAPPCSLSSYRLSQPPNRRSLLRFPGRASNTDNLFTATSSAPRRSKPVPHHHHRNIVKAHQSTQTFTYRVKTDIPLYESPELTSIYYLEDKSRVLKALCPHEKRKPEQINEEEWRIYMAPIDFMFLSATPVVHMRLRCKTKGMGYPSGIPANTSKLLELKVVKSELRGDLDSLIKHTQFNLGVEGVVYPDRKGPRTRIKGYLLMSITFSPPPALALIPQHVHNDVTQLILRTIGEGMERNVNNGLLADYGKFKKEKR
nr:uncharacterized protein LOC109180393 [Ipomoea batatas]